MDLSKIKKLVELLEQSALTELEITEGDNTIRLLRQPAVAPAPSPVAPSPQVAPAAAPPAENHAAAGHIVKSPLVGTFFNAASPEDPPYVKVGAKVAAGDTLCLIEAMKTFNQVEADSAGVVAEILKSNGAPVEYGESLFVIAPE